MKIIVLILIIACQILAGEIPLQLEQIHQSDSPIELSGFALKDNQLYAVSDNSWDTRLYKVELKDKAAIITEGDSFKTLKGYWGYFLSTLLWEQGGHWIKATWDLEGAAVCADDLYLVNEQARDIIKVSKGSMERITVDYTKAYEFFGKEMSKFSPNAGFEGIAADCGSGKLYIAQERGPRGIIVVDLKSNKVSDFFKTSEENNPHPDYADLYFVDGHLYVLERNMRRVLKISPSTNTVIAIASYTQLAEDFKTEELYDTGEPFGLGEALFLDKEFIYIGMDNNVNPFTEKAKKTFGVEKNNSSILKFKRPKGF